MTRWNTHVAIIHEGSRADAEEAGKQLIALAQEQGLTVVSAVTEPEPQAPIHHEIEAVEG